jgi:hypothetical protein
VWSTSAPASLLAQNQRLYSWLPNIDYCYADIFPGFAGFPSWSRDGKRIVYRVWGAEAGLRLVDVGSRAVTVLTKEYDNVPAWSPIDDRIMFTRHVRGEFDIYTIQADGTGLKQITTTPGNDAHAVWSNVRQLTDSRWEDAMPRFVPRKTRR